MLLVGQPIPPFTKDSAMTTAHFSPPNQPNSCCAKRPRQSHRSPPRSFSAGALLVEAVRFSSAEIVVSFKLEICMSRASQIVLVAMALLFGQLQCVAACASQLCGRDFKTEQAPPCHRHHDHSHDQTPGSCTHQPIVLPAASPHTLQLDAPILSALSVVATMSSALPADTWARALGLSAFSPPELKTLSSTVLRI
jgi:hypothetical protein